MKLQLCMCAQTWLQTLNGAELTDPTPPYVAGSFEYGMSVTGNVSTYIGLPGINASETVSLSPAALNDSATKSVTVDGSTDPTVFGGDTPGQFSWSGSVTWSVDIQCGAKSGAQSDAGAVKDGNCRLSVNITDAPSGSIAPGTLVNVSGTVTDTNQALPLVDRTATVYDANTNLPVAAPVSVAADGTFTIPFTVTLATTSLTVVVTGRRDVGSARAIGFNPVVLCSASQNFTLTVVPTPPDASYNMTYCVANTSTNQLTVSWTPPSVGSTICGIQVTQYVVTGTQATLTTTCTPIAGTDLNAGTLMWTDACDGSDGGFK